jgi:catechol 2,3-dioxygenase-like lactoylglutathione lyase family enzyme
MPWRLLVHDKDRARDWYVNNLGFEVKAEWGPAFAILERDGTELWISGPETSAAKPMPDGRVPQPGGWNRPVIVVEEFEELVEGLRAVGVVFRNEPISGPGGSQVLIEDPSGNPVEIFSPR